MKFFSAQDVFFGREKQNGQLEIINDKDSNLINLFRCIKYHCEAVQQELEWIVAARETFFNAVGQLDASGLTDIQRAARYYYKVRCSFGSNQRSFATCAKYINLSMLAQVQERLRGVVIENRDFEPILKTYDRQDALFYLDPPYLGTEQYYASDFAWEDHLRLAEHLKALRGRFFLSYNDDSRIRQIYDGWCTVEPLQRRNNLSGADCNRKSFHELLIRNY